MVNDEQYLALKAAAVPVSVDQVKKKKIDVTRDFLTKNGSDCFEKKQSAGVPTRPTSRNDCTYMAEKGKVHLLSEKSVQVWQ